MFIAEQGVLEQQALLLIESIRLFTTKYTNSLITVISPRASSRPSTRTLEQLEKLQVNYIALDIKSPCPEYGTTFRILASDYFEKYSKADNLVVLDSDTFFLATPDLSLQDADISVRPVDVKGMCSAGPEDPMDLYWQNLCKCCNVDYDIIPNVTTTVDNLEVKASYNGGFVVAKKTANIFQQTKEYFLKSLESDLKPNKNTSCKFQAGHGIVSSEGFQYWGSSQACLSLAVWGSGYTVKTLPDTHNFPLNNLAHFVTPLTETQKTKLVHIHYHHLFSSEAGIKCLFDGQISLPREVSSWLASKIPFSDLEQIR